MSYLEKDARWGVILRLQSIQDRFSGTETAEVADHAISLALNENRPSSFLFRNVWRDAKRSRTRSKLRHPKVHLNGQVRT